MRSDSDPATALDEPHSFVVQHDVAEGKGPAYEQWLKRISPVAKAFPGHLGVQVTPPPPGSLRSRYVTVIRFASRVDADRWADSEERSALIREAEPLLRGGDRFTVKSGLDFWFTPEAVRAEVPVRWKQAVITWTAIFPIVLVVGGAFRWLGRHVEILSPPNLQLLLSTLTAVLLMVYVVMPRYTRLVSGWLFRK